MVTKKEVADLLDQVMELEIPPDLNITFENLKKEISFLRESGQKEYAGLDNNALGNFERLASMLSLDRKSILFVYAAKHIDGIVSYLNGHKSQREDIRGRINDVIVYMILLRAMIDEEEI